MLFLLLFNKFLLSQQKSKKKKKERKKEIFLLLLFFFFFFSVLRDVSLPSLVIGMVKNLCPIWSILSIWFSLLEKDDKTWTSFASSIQLISSHLECVCVYIYIYIYIISIHIQFIIYIILHALLPSILPRICINGLFLYLKKNF